jgi:CRP-like cAMP-binding protein
MSLESAYVFEGVSEQTRQAVRAIAVEESYAPGTIVFRSGDTAVNFYLLSEGRVRLSVLRGGLLSYIVSEPGHAIGWMSMAGMHSYTATAECSTAVRLLRIESAELSRLLYADPASGLAFYRHLSHVIARRLVDSYGATLSLNVQGDLSSFG